MELISIIVPVYNVVKYLEQCVQSLINQSYKQIEIILVNDGSTDLSGNLCDELEKRDERIKVIHKKNEGLGLARNTGLKYVTGKYVTFIDADDYADENLIEELYSAMVENKADTCIGGFKRVDNLGNVLFRERYEYKVYVDNDVLKALLPRMLGSSPEKSDAVRMSVWNVIYSTDIIKQNRLKFPSEREYISEDIIFHIDYYQYSKKCILINTCCYNYRVNDSSLTRTYNKERFEKHKFLYKEICKKIKLYNLSEECVLRFQRQFFVNIRSCIKQEVINSNENNKLIAINNIKSICNDVLVQKIIYNYPVEKLKIKQKTFIYLIKYKMNRMLYLLGYLNAL